MVVWMSGYSQNKDNRTLLTIADEDVPVSEFMRVYTKNLMDEIQMDRESVTEYLELYINFKLKVLEAEDTGLDTVQAFIDELAGYRKQLAEPYFEEDQVIEELLTQAYERKKENVRASHILIRVNEFASPQDTVEAFEKINEVYQRLVEGEDFIKLAEEVSEDPYVNARVDQRSGKTMPGNKGDLGYFSVLDMVYPFESVAYNTKVGEFSKPVRTKHGYHIIKVTDRKPSLGEVQVAHLYLKFPDTATAEDSLTVKLKVDSLFARIEAGENYEELVMNYSDDKGSAARGGMLPKLSVNRLVPEFVEAIYSISDTGGVAQPVLTNYGWHIIKLHETFGILPFEELESDLRQSVQKDTRGKQSKDIIVNRIKNEYGFKQYPEVLDKFYPLVDSSLYEWKWKLPEDFQDEEIVMEIGDKKSTLNQYVGFFAKNQKIGQQEMISEYCNKVFKNFTDEVCIAYEDTKLEEKYPDFKALVKEYRDGILLFELTEEKVWSKAVEDTTGLKNYYEKNKDNYMWGERLDASVFSISDPEFVDPALNLVKKGMNDDEILTQINQDSLQILQVKRKKFSRNDNDLIDNIKWEKGISEPTEQNGSKMFIVVHEKLPPMQKIFNEARGFITADYQTYLEDEWISDLRKKYKVVIHEDVLNSLVE